MSKHTNSPWKITLPYKGMSTLEKDCIPGVKLPIATVEFHRTEETNEANANFIVRACNNHYELLAACKMAKGKMELAAPEDIEEVERVIAKAEGGKR